MFGWFKKEEITFDFFSTDVHSHLLPGIDDGAQNIEETIENVRNLYSLGFKRFITTPHIMGDSYKNTPEIIKNALEIARNAIKDEFPDVILEAAAEYYLDEHFINLIDTNSELLTFGKNHILFETSYINEPSQLHSVIFNLKSKGYIPVLAHPERYHFIHGVEKLKEIKERGALLQMNLNSLAGYYSKPVKKLAEAMVDHKLVDLVGTDYHGTRHFEPLKNTFSKKHFKKLKDLDLLNYKL